MECGWVGWREEPLHPGTDAPSLVDLLRVARSAVEAALCSEDDSWVREELEFASASTGRARVGGFATASVV